MKSLRLLLLLLMLSFTGIIKADELVIQDFQLLPEQQTSVAVELNNTDRQYIMLDFFIQLPSGVTIARDEDDELMYELNSTRARRSHSLEIREQSNGSYRVLLYSSSNEALKGTSGAVFTMTLEADASATSGDYTGALTNQLAMDINKNKLNFLDKSFNVLIKSVQQPQSLSLENLPVMTYGDAAYTLPAMTDQNQTLTWSSNNTDVATVSGNMLTVKGAGTATITASQVGSESYTPFSKTFTLTVNKAALTVTADDCSRMEGAENPVFTISYSGFKYNDNASSLTTQPTAASEATTSSPAGTYPITVSGGSSDNYEFNYVNGTLTVTAKNNQTISLSSIPAMTYGDGTITLPAKTDQNQTLAWTCNNTSVATVSGNTLTVKGAGVATITASQAGNGTYNSFSKTFTLTVNKTPLTITADDKTKTAGQANPSLTVSYSGFVNGESSSVLTTQPTVTTTATASSAAGTYPITVSGAAAANYEIIYVEGTLTVVKADQTVTLTAIPMMTYGDAAYTLPAKTAQNQTLTWASNNTNVATTSGNTLTVKGAGTATITASQAGNETYNPFSKTFTLTVNKAALTVTADDCSRMEGAANPTFTISYSGFKYNDNASSLTTQPTAVSEATASSPAGTYPITVSGGQSDNYEFNYVNGTLTVTEDNEDLYIQFADATVDSLCVSNWDTNGDGKLSYEEAAAVTNLGTVFQDNKSITSFNELKYFTGLSSIGLRAFRYCSSLTNIIIPEGVTSIGHFAFYGCCSLSSITIPNSVTTIGIEAFHGDNDSQTSIVVESGNIVYDSRNNCNALIETSTNTLIKGCRNTVIPEDVVAIGDWAFSNCSSLTSITIPNSVTSIGDGVFNGCTGLTSITIPNRMTTIGAKAFNGCTGLTSITIPNRVTTIGAKAFNGCNSLTLVRLYSNSIVSDTYTDSSNLKDIFGNQVQTYILGSGVTSIGDYAFYQCNNISSVSIGSKVESIGKYAFYGCTGLTSMTFKDGMSIGDYAFYGCTGLTSMTFKDGMSIGDWAFCDCSGLTNIIMPDGLYKLGNYAFARCGLTSVVIPRCSSIGKYCFGGCSSLLSVTFGNGNNINAIPEGMFEACRSLTSLGVIGSGASIEIPNSVTFINKYAFRNCSGLTSVTIPNSVTQVYQVSAFIGCTGLEYLVIGNGLTSIPSNYFMDCKNLKSVTIGTSVTSIGALAFYNSSKLAQVRVCNPTPITISDLVFPYRSTATLVVPSREAKSAYKAADYWKDFKLILFEGEDFSNVLEVSDMVVDHGAFAELPVNMTNQDKITAVEFDLEMPSGFKLLSCSLTERKGDHGINYAQSENGSYHVTIFSLSSSVFTGSTGDLFTLHLLADSLGQHIIAVKNVELSTNDGDKRTPQDISASVTICDIPIGDVNGDGEVTITDAVSIVNHRLNRTPVRFISAAADLNADNEITITDAVRIVNMILSDQSNAKLRTESAISLPEPQ